MRRAGPACTCGYDLRGTPRAADGSAVCPECGEIAGHLIPRCERCGEPVSPEARVRAVVCEGCGAVSGRGALPPFRRRPWPRPWRLGLILTGPTLLGVGACVALAPVAPEVAGLLALATCVVGFVWALVAPPCITVSREPHASRMGVTLLLIVLALLLNGVLIAGLLAVGWLIA